MELKLKFTLEKYEGPLEVLLNLIDKNKINIYDIPISVIFTQYIEYLDLMREMDMDITVEFINMAVELMVIKSKMLLPKIDNNDADPRSTLTAALIEYKLIKEAAEDLKERYILYSGRFTKETSVSIEKEIILKDHDIKLLIEAYERIKTRMENNSVNEERVERQINYLVNIKITPIYEKIFAVMRYMYNNEICDLPALLEQGKNRSDLISIFAAVLELLKSQRIILVIDDEHEPQFILNKTRKIKK